MPYNINNDTMQERQKERCKVQAATLEEPAEAQKCELFIVGKRKAEAKQSGKRNS